MEQFLNLLISALISSSIVGVILGLIFKRRNEIIASEVKNQFEKNMTVFKSNYIWKEKIISELLGQIYMQFNRTKRAFDRYQDTNVYLEAKVLKDGNEKIRNLLLEKAHLIPLELTDDASQLIEHYDVWLEEFNKHRNDENPNLDQKFIFAGPKGYIFPRVAEQNFKKKYHELREELFT
ncbi:hypothetical protein GCM10011344_00550 [Dokdonia pacifica]|uniref:Uncharacterized protein n=1 Tax=Dokdonia pacifica TaxID=1627892 RepID=A0A239D0L6_9FLAO|nr:hypothetical protein [Dokdonia pacifica]GGG04066.1 hypothetical protein GCM10011344_00550 [Dokdonia pacifica]SNS25975.1 hypothetical protein SAMN06265376_10985 [Dokdonia pacifica]